MQTYSVKNIFPEVNRESFTKDNPLVVTVPGSKSITNRALLLATLAKGKSTLKGVLFSDDSRHFLKCIQELGFETTVDEENKIITVIGDGACIPKKEASIYVGSAGTAARFLTSYLGISQGKYYCDASEQMKKRPMHPLLNSLKELGCQIEFAGEEGFFPFTLNSHGFGKSEISIDIDKSSQFLSALLISACLCPDDFTINIVGTHGMAYIDMTVKMMEQFGVIATKTSEASYTIKKNQGYKPLDYQIEPDASAACYFYAMAPLLGIPVIVENVFFDSLQGDVQFIKILEKMGCSSRETQRGIMVIPPASGEMQGVDIDMSTCSDQAITLAAIAPFAKTPTTITGIGHIRLQESDRINAIVTELKKMNIECEEGSDFVKIYPGNPSSSQVDTYDDHRMAMGFSLIGLKSDGIIINDPLCCRKTFENYFQILDEVCRKLCIH